MNHEQDGNTRRHLLGAAGFGALLMASGALAATPAVPTAPATPTGPAIKPALTKPWRLLVNEAFTGESNLFILTARYQPFAEYVTASVRGKPGIAIEPIVDVRRFMSLAKTSPRPQLVFGKTVNQLAKLVRDEGYQPVVRRSDPYKAAFIVAKGSPIRELKDVGPAHAKIIMPDEMAATTAVARAELRRQNAGDVQIVHTRYQEAVAQQIANGFGQVGVVNPTIARKWAEEGGRVIGETQGVVNWSVLASPEFVEADVALLRASLMAMNAGAPAVLAGLGIKQWAGAERSDYLALLDYTKE